MIKSITTLFLFTVFFSHALISRGQVTASFTVADTAGCVPLVDNFINTSSGATRYTWDLGNGTTTTLTNASGSYVTAGTYTVTLTAYNGTSSSVYRAIVNVYAIPTVRFTASDTTVCPGIATTFTSTSIAGAPGVMTYSWNFGDGATSTAASPSHPYTTPGDYNVTLFVTNGKGCINSLSKDPYIHVYTPPSPGFSAVSSYVCRSPGNVTFTNSTIGSGPLTYLWRFYDGTTSALTAPTHHYTSPGVYSVSLRVTDVNGCIDSFLYTSYITVGGLTASFTPITNACINLPDTFVNTSTTHLISGWNFGDGTSSVSEDGIHTYTATGTYSVQLIVFDGTCYDTIVHPVTITHPTGSFTISPTEPCPQPTTLTFNASVTPGSTVAWSSYYYGALGTGSTFSHLFPYVVVTPPGGGPDTVGLIDSITMIITNAYGCADTVGKRDTINKMELSVIPALVDGCSPVTGNFSLQVSSNVYDIFAEYPFYEYGLPPPLIIGYPYPVGVSSYLWNFGDGSPTSTAATPTHIYSVVGGVYNVKCKIATINGCTDSVTALKEVAVGSQPPTPSFTMSTQHECAGVRVYFHSTATGTFDTYKWDYGDGNADTGAAPSHVFTVPGVFTVELKTQYNGCPSLSFTLKDTVDSPSAVIYDSFKCVPRNEVVFKDWSLGDDTHLWQFGDGTTSTASVLTHTYPAVSIYTVMLTTYNRGSGCRDTELYNLNLTPLNASLTDEYSSICRDQKDAFYAGVSLSPGDSTWVTKYRWFVNGVITDSLVSGFLHDTEVYTFHTTGTSQGMFVLTDNHGCFDTLTTSVLVAKPVANFNFTPTSGCAPLLVNITDLSTPTPGSSITNYYWSFGDGYTGTTASPTIAHSYNMDGSFSIEEIITDNVGCKDTFTNATSVIAHKPSAAFHAGIPTICARSGVTFYNTSSGAATYLWLFGDGDTSTAVAPTHIYSTAGTYSVTLVAISSAGCRDTMTIPSYIQVNPTPTASFTMSDSFAVCAPFSVNFTNTSTGVGPTGTNLWAFGDHTSLFAVSPTYVYVSPGLYRVVLTVHNSFSCADSAIGHVNIFGYSGAFTYSPLTGCPPTPVHFIATFTSVASVVWDFDDGVTSPSTLDTITHTYISPGEFVPKLILQDTNGCTAASIGADTIKLGNVAAAFYATPNPVCQHDTVTFHDTSSAGVLPITGWLWTFAPGVTSTLSSPTYVYSLSGTYVVTLTVTCAGGCTGTTTNTVTVVALPPPISGPSVICVGSSSAFSNTILGGTWSSSLPTIASVNPVSGMVTGVARGVATITYSIGSGCTVTKLVTVDAPPSAITGLGDVCIGLTITLTDTTRFGVWTSSSTSVASVGSLNGIVLGASAGTDTISYTVGSCAAIKVVTVNPPASPITGTTNVCIGTTSLLSSSPPGGIWASSAPLTIASVGSLSGIVTGIAAGSAIITYTPATGCIGLVTVSVNPPPGTISGGSFVCIGGSTTLSNTVRGGVWSSSNPFIATVGSISGVVTGQSLGIDTINYNAGGCTVSKVVSVNSLPPAIMGPGIVCLYSTITLSDADTGGIWTSSNPSAASVGSSTGIVTGVTLGTSTIIYSLGGGCTITTPVTVDPLPANILGPQHVCLNAIITLTDTTLGGSWSSSSPPTATVSTSGVVTGLVGGLDTIYYTIPTGCRVPAMVSVVAVPPITGLTNLCAWVDTLSVHDIDTSGTYSSSLVTISNVGGGDGLISTFAPGQARIIYTVPLGCTTSDTITINPSPAIITGNVRICLGDSTILHDTSSGGVWSTSSTFASVNSLTGLVTSSSPGVAYITYTIPTGCKIDTSVTIYTVPTTAGTITGPNDVCVGDSIVLTDTVPGGVWSSSSSGASVSGGTVSGVSAGSVTIYYSIINICGSAVSGTPVIIYPAVSAGTISGNDTVCVGSTITLTDGISGGAWTISDSTVATISSGGVVSGLIQGADTVMYTVNNPACTAKTTYPVIIDPLPVASGISGNTALCVGDSSMITVTIAGGSWNQSMAITTLRPVTGGAVAIADAAGVDSIYYTVTNNCSTAPATLVLNISTAPVVQPIQGVNELCAGQDTTYSDPVKGGVWAIGNTVVDAIGSTSGILSAKAAGNDTVTYTVVNACGEAATNKPVKIDPLPVAGSISGNATMCVGDSLVLSDSVKGGIWSIGNASANIKGSVIVTGVSAGDDVLSYSVSNNCGTAVATQAITVESLPDSIDITANGNVLSVPSGYPAYQWLLNGVPIQGATTNSYTATNSGSYSVMVRNSLGCSAVSPVKVVTECPASDILVYPNPVSSVIYIQWCSSVTARLNTIDGKMLQLVKNATQLDISYLPNAIYTLTLFDADGNKLVTKRITKLSQ